MKVLLLLRHGNASASMPVYDDFDRPLDADGYKSLNDLVFALKDKTLAPEVVLCSPARRTRETLEFLRAFLPENAEVYFEEGLYLANLQRMRECLETVPDPINNVLVIGHNPGLDQLLAWMLSCSSDSRDAWVSFPMGGMAQLNLASDTWSLPEQVTCNLVRFIFPSPYDESDNDASNAVSA